MRRALLILMLFMLAGGLVPAYSAVSGGGSADAVAAPPASTGSGRPPVVSLRNASNLTALPATVSGSISNYRPGESISFHLDSPDGPALAGAVSPNPVASHGHAWVSVTIPTGTSNGPHEVYVVGRG